MGIVIPYVKNATWADGSGGGTPDTAAKKNLIEDGLYSAHLQPCARVYHSVNQSTTSGVGLVLAFNTELIDQAGGAAATQHDVVTNNSRLTCRYAGVYSIQSSVQFAANATGQRALSLRLNGGGGFLIDAMQVDATAAGACQIQIVTYYLLAVNDYVEVIATQNSGGALNVVNALGFAPSFGWARVG